MTQDQMTATTAWNDLAMRPNTTSTEGQVPVTGSIFICPDIIPQTSAVNDPQDAFSATTSWANDYAAQVNENAPNYIYVRARNFYPTAETGTISLYAVPCTLINWPQQWLNNPLTVQAGGGTSVNLSATTNQQIVVGDQPFYWVAPPPPSGSDHYCLISLLDTPETPNQLLHSNVPQTYNTMADLATNCLNVGWKNVAEVASNVPTWTHSMTMMVPPGAGANEILHVYCFGTQGTVGGQVAISSGDSQGFNPPITIQQTTIASPTTTYGTLVMPTPGVASTTLNVSFWQGSSNPGFSDRISVICGWVPQDTDAIEPLIRSGAARRLPAEIASHPTAKDTPGWEVPIGAQHYTFVDPS